MHCGYPSDCMAEGTRFYEFFYEIYIYILPYPPVSVIFSEGVENKIVAISYLLKPKNTNEKNICMCVTLLYFIMCVCMWRFGWIDFSIS